VPKLVTEVIGDVIIVTGEVITDVTGDVITDITGVITDVTGDSIMEIVVCGVTKSTKITRHIKQ